MKTPTLRFRGFKDEWNPKIIGEISLKIGSGSTPLGGESAYVDSGIPFIRSQNVANNKLNLADIRFIPESINSKMAPTIVRPNDILLNITGASIGRSCVVPENFTCGNVNQHVCIIRLKEDQVPAFYQAYIASNRGQNMIMSTQVGGGREGLNFQAIRKFKISSPELEEQLKIGNFLQKVDQKIALLTKKHELLMQYKKGVMQKIFNQEIRFKNKNGDDYSGWALIALSEIGDTYNGLTGKTAEDFGSGAAYVTYKQIFDSSKINPSKFGFVNIKSGERQNEVQYGDLFFTTSSETAAEVGYCSALLDNVKNLYLNSFCFGFRIRSLDTFSPKFARFMFFSPKVRESIVLLAQGSTRYNISKTGFMKIKVPVPCQEEQLQISNFLESLEEKLALIANQIELTKKYKQGLLQQMFI